MTDAVQNLVRAAELMIQWLDGIADDSPLSNTNAVQNLTAAIAAVKNQQDTDEHKIVQCCAYAAWFALQCHQYQQDGRGGATDEVMDHCMEDADCIGQEAAMRFGKAPPIRDQLRRSE